MPYRFQVELQAQLTAAENQNAALRDVANELAQACRTHAEVRKRENEPASNANHATFYQIFEITQKVDKILSSPPSNRIAKLERVAEAVEGLKQPTYGATTGEACCWYCCVDVFEGHEENCEWENVQNALADLKGGECGED